MRARAGDPPRTMAQKILAGADARIRRSRATSSRSKVDQVVLARAPARALGEAVAAGLKKTSVEVAIAYDGRCVTDATRGGTTRGAASVEMLAHGVLVARAGVGFPAPVHLERFASPARLCVTDEPRLAGVGGVGMLVARRAARRRSRRRSRTGSVLAAAAASACRCSSAGRLRPFVCARDVALELLRRGLGDVVRRVEEARGAPVVLEFAGPSARAALGGRARACSRASRRSSARRPRSSSATSGPRSSCATSAAPRRTARSSPDAGAPCDEVVTVDLGAVDPLLLDEQGQVRAVRDLAGQPVSAGRSSAATAASTLRDLFAAATLLKSKRVPSRLDFLLAVAVAADARGARRRRRADGPHRDRRAPRRAGRARRHGRALRRRPPTGVAIRTCDPEPRAARRPARAPSSPPPRRSRTRSRRARWATRAPSSAPCA